MNKATSFYLDCLRVLAAFGVLLVHANLPWFSDGLFLRAEMGHKLVMIFFVLSGYLIAYTVHEKNKGPERYLIDRFSRLYSVVLPALVFTYLLDYVGQHFNPGFYAEQVAPDHQVLRFLLNATYLQQIWGFCTKPSSNGPFWSIAYEFWYYMLFGVLCYLKGAKRFMGIAGISLLVGLKILILLPVWFLGVLAYHYSARCVLKVKSATFIFWGSLGAILLLSFGWDFGVFESRFVFGSAPLYFSSRFVFDWIYGALIALNIFSLRWVAERDPISPLVERSVKYLSAITFTLYLFHLPLLIFIGALVPYNRASYLQTISLLIGVVILVGLFAHITERQRNHWKTGFGKIVHWVSHKLSRPATA